MIAALLAALLPVLVMGGAPTPRADAAEAFAPLVPPEGCVDGTVPDPQKGLEPNQIAAAYDMSPLWDAGYRGQGVRMALIEPGQTYDPTKYQAFVDCWGAPVHPPTQVVVGDGGSVPVGSEATFDVQVAVGTAPALDGLYVMSSPSPDLAESLPTLLAAALDTGNTGGVPVDVISISFGKCEADWQATAAGRAGFAATEAQLQRAAEQGTKVFVAGGDSGSVACATHPVVPGSPGSDELAVGYPGTSSWVTAVGGTQFELDGTIEHGGTITVERVWNAATDDGTAFYGGGGGLSALVALPDYQATYGLTGAHAHKPDVAALAGFPRFPGGGIGTSGAAPLTASGIALVDSYLLGHGVAPLGALNPLLYALARTSDGPSVLSDVTVGNNDIMSLGCCRAGVGYDEASGLGSIRFAHLAAVVRASAATSTTAAGASPADPATATPSFTG